MEALRERVGPAVAMAAAAAALLGLEVVLGASSWDLQSATTAAVGIGLVGLAVALAPVAQVLALFVFGTGYSLQTAASGLVDSVVVLVVWTALLVLVARHRPLGAAVVGGAVGAVPLVVFALESEGPAPRVGPATFAVWVVPWACGRALRARAQRHDADLAVVRAEADRQASEERAAAAEERTALARDVHDLLGHALTTVVVQVRAAAAVLPPGATASGEALRSVDDVASAALGELRSLVGALQGAAPAAARAEPSLADLDALLARMPLSVVVDLDERLLAATTAVQQCLFRVVQEALTNCVRHSAAEEVRVSVVQRAARACVRVDDPGPHRDTSVASGGHGIPGMRARVTELGGTLETGTSGVGFTVRAEVPLGGRE